MKKTLLLICLSSLSIIGFTQPFSSSILSGTDYVGNGDLIRFNNKNIIVASETCNGFFEIDCTYIFEVDDNNNITNLLNVGELRLFRKSISANDEFLTIVGLHTNSELKILKFNTDFELVTEAIHTIGSAPSYWIFDMVEFSDSYVVAVFSTGNANTNSNFPSLIWINADDLSLSATCVVEEHEASFKELTVDIDNNLKVVKHQNDQYEIITYNAEKQVINSWNVPQDGNISFLNFDQTNNGALLLGLYENRNLIKYNAQGEFDWEVDIASRFGVQEVQFIRELKEISDGNIMLSGSLEKDNEQFGFIYLMKSNGEEKWKRLYKLDSSVWTSPLKSFVELEDGSFMFYGSLRQEPFPAQNNFHDTHWVLRTDSEGCLDSDCGEELPVATIEIDENEISVFPNPTSTIINIKGLENHSNKEIILTDLTGKIIMTKYISDQTFNLDFLNSGIYFLQIKVEENLVLTEKIIKI